MLHAFDGPDGGWPSGNLTVSGSNVFGMTQGGGDKSNGVVFVMNTDGSAHQVLHNFDTGTAWASLTLCGSVLYGMVEGEGTNGLGAVFQINTDGSGYQVLHTFTGADGAYPEGSLMLSGSTFYGMATGGGSNGYGVVYRMNIDGSGYQVMHHFVAYPTDGAYPFGTLILSGSTLYGLTAYGGNTRDGTVFKIDTDGTGYQLLHSFDSRVKDNGGVPYGSLTLSGSTLYGMTSIGGSNNMGTVFQINTDGTGFQVLHNFNNSESPNGSLTLSGSTLYGMTAYGGSNNMGTVFQINTDSTGFQVLSSFNGSNGAYPQDSVVSDGSTLYGMTEHGGGKNMGVVFSLALPTPYQAWQMKYFGCTDCAEAADSTDRDGDGQSNLAEFLAGTDPTNSASLFRITSVAPQGNDLFITWNMGSGKTNALQAASSGGYGTNGFTDIFIVTNTVGTVTNYFDIGAATNTPARYYRVRLVP